MSRFKNIEPTEFNKWFSKNNKAVGVINQDIPFPAPSTLYTRLDVMYAEPKRVRLYVYNSAAIKDSLKTSGYKFSENERAWYFDFNSISAAVAGSKKIM